MLYVYDWMKKFKNIKEVKKIMFCSDTLDTSWNTLSMTIQF